MSRLGWIGLAVLALLLVCPIAVAMDPPDRTPMGVLQQDNAEVAPGVAWNHVLNGFYYVHSDTLPDPTTKWLLVPPTLGQDNVGATGVVLEWWSGNQTEWTSSPSILPVWGSRSGHGGYWARVKAATPGWVKVELHQHNAPVDDGTYCFYDALLVEDDVGGYLGFDARYGGSAPVWFAEEGGYHFGDARCEPEPASESILGFDDRYEDGVLEGELSAWSGLSRSSPRTGRWMPESQLGFHVTRGLNSLMANTRNLLTLRLFVAGPHEPLVNIPIRLACKGTTDTGGELQPGSPGPGQSYEVKVDWFNPPARYDLGFPGNGLWPWPLNVNQIPTPLPFIKRNRLDGPPPVPDPARQRKWLLRVPVKASQTASGAPRHSLGYADIEIETRIPNFLPLAQMFGDDPTGTQEGILQFRWGTVLQLDSIEVRTGEPDEVDLALLKDHWLRQVKYELWSENAIIEPRLATLSLGVLVKVGTDGREDDVARFEVVDSAIAPDDTEYVEPYFREVSASAVNRKIPIEREIEFPDSHWTRAEWPEDARESWYGVEGNFTRPQSMEVVLRGYVGQVGRGPDVGDFENEPREPKDVPAQGAPLDADTPITRTDFVHFINVISDVHEDGELDALDDDEVLEEGLDGPGLDVNCVKIDGPQSGPDINMRRCVVLLSSGEMPSEDYRLQIYAESPKEELELWRDANRDDLCEWNNVLACWIVPIPTNGSDPEIWLANRQPVVTRDRLRVFLAHREQDSAGGIVWRRQALDEVVLCLHNFGLRVNSNNDPDGLITLDEDDAIEEQFPGLIAVKKDNRSFELQIDKVIPDSPSQSQPRGVWIEAYGAQAGPRGSVDLLDDANSKTWSAAQLNVEGGVQVADEAEIVAHWLGAEGSVPLVWRILPKATGVLKLRMTLRRGGEVIEKCDDYVVITVATGDLKVHHGFSDPGEVVAVVEENEEVVTSGDIKGAATAANLNNSGGTTSNQSPEPSETDWGRSGSIGGERDLVKLIVGELEPILVGELPLVGTFSKIRLKIETREPYVRFYENGNRSGLVSLTEYAVEWPADDFANASSTKDVWAEFGAMSTGIGDYSLILEAKVQGSEFWVRLDRVSVTAIWSTATVYISNNDGMPSLPSGSNTEATILAHKDVTNNNTLFGWGKWEWPWEGGTVVQGGGRVEVIYEVQPQGAQGLGVYFDATRQVGDGYWYTTSAALESWVIGNSNSSWRLATLADEEPNDDGYANEEYFGRSGAGQFYACDWDAPNLIRSGDYVDAYVKLSRRFVAKSWLRGRVPSGDRFTNGNQRIGSRVSPKYVWRVSWDWVKSSGAFIDSPGTSQKCEMGYLNSTLGPPDGA